MASEELSTAAEAPATMLSLAVDSEPTATPVASALSDAARLPQKRQLWQSLSPDLQAVSSDAIDPELSPKKLARLSSVSRFGETPASLTLLSAQDNDEQQVDQAAQRQELRPDVLQEDGQQRVEQQGLPEPTTEPTDLSADAATAARNNEAAQATLSILRGTEAFILQRAASEAATLNAAADVAPAGSDAAATASGPAGGSDSGNGGDDAAAASIQPDIAAAVTAAAALAEAAADQQPNADSTDTALATTHAVSASPPVDGDALQGNGQIDGQLQVGTPDHHTDSFYPSPALPTTPATGATENNHTMSAPRPMPDLTPRSPSSKRHKCPFCETEFTRHHNLKSHLLTHSQEKPYSCPNCDMKFRRLHDLKRHGKLHTGEKPHICLRCDRKFARGDALARHSKGAGGCAGRRSSSGGNFPGGMSGDDSFEGTSVLTDADDSAMAGIEFDGVPSAVGDDEDQRGVGAASNKPLHGRVAAGAFTTPAQSRPSISKGKRPPAASGIGIFPPTAGSRVSAPSALSTTNSTTAATAATSRTTPITTLPPLAPVATGGASLFSQQGIAESPKPISPAVSSRPGAINATGAAEASSRSGQQFSDRRVDLATAQSMGAAETGLQLVRPTSNGDTNANMFSSEQGMWTYIQTMEGRLKAQEERIASFEAAEQDYESRIASLTKEINTLRSQSAESSSTAGKVKAGSEAKEVPDAVATAAAAIAAVSAATKGLTAGPEATLSASEAALTAIREAAAAAAAAEANAVHMPELNLEQHIEQQLKKHVGQQQIESTAEQ